jgi:hypothetical protein
MWKIKLIILPKKKIPDMKEIKSHYLKFYMFNNDNNNNNNHEEIMSKTK